MHLETFCDRPQVPLSLRLGPLTALSIGVGLAPRLGRGTQYRQSRLPDKPLDIWGALQRPCSVSCQRMRGCQRSRTGLSEERAMTLL